MPIETLINAVKHWAGRTFATKQAAAQAKADAAAAQATADAAQAAVEADAIDPTQHEVTFTVSGVTGNYSAPGFNVAPNRFYYVSVEIAGGTYKYGSNVATPSNTSYMLLCRSTEYDEGVGRLLPYAKIASLDGDPAANACIYIQSIMAENVSVKNKSLTGYTASEAATVTLKIWQVSAEDVLTEGYLNLDGERYADNSCRLVYDSAKVGYVLGSSMAVTPLATSTELAALEARVAALEAASTS